jgi:hypothetical protein
MGADHEGLWAEHDRTVADMPPAITAIYRGILDPMISDLGESPEAWRGAIRIGMEILKGLSTEHERGANPITWEEARGQFIIVIIVGLMNTPWGRQALDDMQGSSEQRMRAMVDECMRGLITEVFE